MKLDEYEIDYVKYYIQVKGYHEYEVLAEILDHFVLLLEEEKDKNPEVRFEDLVDKVYDVSGKSAFKEINQSTKKRVAKKYMRLFFGHLMVFLHYEYVLMIAVAGLLLYQLQSLFQNTLDYLVIHTISTFTMYFVIFKFSSATELGNPKFMCNKITKRYGAYLLIIATIIFRILIEIVLKPVTFGFNTFYLISTVVLIVQAVVSYALIRTARLIVEESFSMEETYQILK